VKTVALIAQKGGVGMSRWKTTAKRSWPIHSALFASDLAPGDEVILPSYGFLAMLTPTVAPRLYRIECALRAFISREHSYSFHPIEDISLDLPIRFRKRVNRRDRF